MKSLLGKELRITDSFGGDTTDHQWIPLTKDQRCGAFSRWEPEQLLYKSLIAGDLRHHDPNMAVLLWMTLTGAI